MARGPPANPLVSITIALVLGSAVGAGIWFGVERVGVPAPTPLQGDFAHLTLSSSHWTDWRGHNITAPIVTATLQLTSPVTLDPQGVVITITGPNSTLLALNGSKDVRVPSIEEVYLPSWYPHWMGTWPMGSAPAYSVWGGYAVTFVNPDGAIVGGMNSSIPSAAGIESGATMTVEFPGGADFPSTASGFTVTLSVGGHPGALVLAIP